MITPPHSREHWNARPNTKEIDGADYMLRHSKRMDRILGVIARTDLPEQVDLPDDRPVLFAANHRSFLDIAVAMAVFGNLSISCRMQVRADMFDKRIIGPWLTGLQCIPTNKDVREDAEATALATLQGGSTVAIMPEGRLVPPKDRPNGVGQARTGISRIVKQANAVVVPVAIHGSDAIWPKRRPFPKLGLFRRRDLIVRLGQPLEFESGDHQTNADYLMATIADMLREIEAELAR